LIQSSTVSPSFLFAGYKKRKAFIDIRVVRTNFRRCVVLKSEVSEIEEVLDRSRANELQALSFMTRYSKLSLHSLKRRK
jgi:hypothetical protein